MKYDILQKFAENCDIHLESLKSELNLLPGTIQQYELRNNIKINKLITSQIYQQYYSRMTTCLCLLSTLGKHLQWFEGTIPVYLNMVIPDWVLDPFSNVNTAGSSQLEEQLLELTTNEELKIKFKNG